MVQFNIRRFWSILKWTVGTEKKQLINAFASCVIIFFAIEITGLVFSSDLSAMSRDQFVNDILSGAVSVCTAASMLMLLIMGSKMFDKMSRRSHATAFLMQPASNIEKFLARFLLITVGYVAGMFVAFCLADTLRLLVGVIIGMPYAESGVPLVKNPFVFTIRIDVQRVSSLLLGFSHAIFLHSFYVLGGTLLRRYKFVITSGMLILLVVLLFKVIDIDARSSDEIRSMLFGLFTHEALYSSFFILLALCCYYASYRIFCRIQVVNNKWLNL